MLPYTVIKEANPPQHERHRHRRRSTSQLHVQRAARARSSVGSSCSASAAAPGDGRSSTTRRRSSRCCSAWRIAIVLTLFLKETGPAVQRRSAAGRRRRPSMTTDTGTGKYEAPAGALPQPRADCRPPSRIRARQRRWRARSRPREQGLIVPILVGPAAKIARVARQRGHRSRRRRDRRCAAQPCVGGQGRGAGARRARPSC